MAFQPAIDITQVHFNYVLGGQPCENVMAFKWTPGGVGPENISLLLNNLTTWATDQLLPQLSDQALLLNVQGRDLTTQFSFQAINNIDTPGSISGDVEPNNVAPAISFRTGLSGRSFRGRNYLIGIPASVVTGNNIDSTWANDTVAAYNLLLFTGGALPDGWIWVILSRTFNGFARPEGLGQEVMSVLFTDLVVDSQRDRLPNHKRVKRTPTP